MRSALRGEPMSCHEAVEYLQLAQALVWVAVGAYCRRERLQRSALAKKLAQSSGG